MDIRLAQALWTLGLLRADELPTTAAEALEAGIDSHAVRLLAGLSTAEFSEGPELFTQCLRELGIPSMTKADAARNVAASVSRSVLAGEETPRGAAERLWDVSVRVGDANFHDLDFFIYAASEMQSRPDDEAYFNGEILREAHEWLSRG